MKTQDANMLSVLFVDDDVIISQHYQKELSNRFGAKVTMASTVAEANQALATGRFDLVVTDLVLEPSPGGNDSGLDIIREVQRRDVDLPIIVLSGFAGSYRDDLTRLGVTVVAKGRGPQRFLDVVEQTLQKRQASPKAKSIRETLSLEAVRRIFAEEAARLLSAKERTVTVPGQGQFELLKSLQGFKEDIERQLLQFPFERNVFLMMKFRPANHDMANYIRDTLAATGFHCVRADDEQWNITNSVYNPVAVLYCCKYGIALFDEPESAQAYSANVAYELGMMHLQNKKCLILKHSSLPQVPFDLIKDLHVPYDRDLQLRKIIERWVKDTCILR